MMTVSTRGTRRPLLRYAFSTTRDCEQKDKVVLLTTPTAGESSKPWA